MAINHFVLDTNVLVSAFIFKSKNPTDVLKRFSIKGKIALSEAALDEYQNTLLDKKFDSFISREIREQSLSAFVLSCEIFIPTKKIAICRDADDNKWIELAVAADAACIVTGDNDLLILQTFENIPILSPKEFLERF